MYIYLYQVKLSEFATLKSIFFIMMKSSFFIHYKLNNMPVMF